jgi:membrane associated rhomboid family serine protease
MSTTETTQTCYRHPSRETGVSCSSCGRPICPDCMTPTPVGMRCPECASQRTRVHTLRSTAVQPRVTFTLIAINVLAFLSTGQFSVANGSSSDTLFYRGELYGPAIHVQHQYYRLLTAGFLHLNVLHIASNMYVLYVLGIILEPAIGSRRFALIYFVSLLAGSFGALVATPHGTTVGASGAVFGIAGAFAVELRARGVNPLTSGIGIFIILNLVLSFTLSGISIGGHIGGLLAGALCAVILQGSDRRRVPRLGEALCVLVGVLAVLGAIAVAPAGPTHYPL